MAAIEELLENELKAAFEVKSEQSLHNYVVLLVERMIEREDYIEDRGSLKSDIRSITDTMREGFKRMDERFAAVDKRFEDLIGQMNARFEGVDKRFENLTGQMNVRFEGIDKRFEDLIAQMNSRFNMMFFFMSAGFTILTVLLTLYRFIG